MSSSQSLHVELAGIRLSVRTDASRETVDAIVDDIESRLHRINEQSQNTPLNRRLILATLMLGEDLHNAQALADENEAARKEAERASDEAQRTASLSSDKAEQLQDELDSVKRDNAQLQERVQSLTTQLETLQREVDTERTRAQDAEAQAKQLKHKATASGESQQQVRELQDQVESKELRLAELEELRTTVAERAQTALKLLDSER